jgi:hypothetical protein
MTASSMAASTMGAAAPSIESSGDDLTITSAGKVSLQGAVPVDDLGAAIATLQQKQQSLEASCVPMAVLVRWPHPPLQHFLEPSCSGE